MSQSRQALVAEQYMDRLDGLHAVEVKLRRADRLFIGAKVSVGIFAVGLAVWLAKYHATQISYLLVPLLLIGLLFVLHERTLASLRSNTSLRGFYERGMARLEDRWFTLPAGVPQSPSAEETGEQYLSKAHPYARDLDIFGPGSVYHLLCTARTRIGRDTIASWLLTAAPVEEVKQRQQAVKELAPLFEFRERLLLTGSALDEKAAKSGATPEAFARWAESTDSVNRHLRIRATALAVLWVIAVIAWQLVSGGSIYLLAVIAMSVINLLYGYRHREGLNRARQAIAAATEDIDSLAAILAVLESEPFVNPRLKSLQASLKSTAAQEPVSKAMVSLARRSDWLASGDNWFVKVLDPFIFWSLQCVFSIEDWRRRHGAAVRGWLAAIGEMEALVAIAVYACEHPDDAFPEFTVRSPFFHAIDFAHPLLPRSRTVRNSIRLDHQLQMIVISGPNMAGKSTFIRSVGINAVLAQAGAPVCAREMTLSPLAVAASICILDSLQGGLSRFYAEILRLKEIDDLSRQSVPVLFLLDELLSGTNSHDRRLGTESMVRSLIEREAIGLVTTHDLALAEIADSMNGKAANFHFEDRYADGKLYFEYKLTPGIVRTSNALQLMRSIGLDV